MKSLTLALQIRYILCTAAASRKQELPVPSPEISLRPSTESDADEIFSIRMHPLVAKYQYPLKDSDTPERFVEQMIATSSEPGSAPESLTIFHNDTIVGHVIQQEFKEEDGAIYYCGFNVHPDFWGQGIMTTSLPKVLDQLFESYNAHAIVCDCFRSNRRCQRLLERTGFLRAPIPLFHQAQAALKTRCIRWLKRYFVTRDDWLSTDGEDPQ